MDVTIRATPITPTSTPVTILWGSVAGTAERTGVGLLLYTLRSDIMHRALHQTGSVPHNGIGVQLCMCMVGDETSCCPGSNGQGVSAQEAGHAKQNMTPSRLPAVCCPSLAVSCPTKSAGNTTTALLTPSQLQEPPGTAPTGARLVRRLLQRQRPHQVCRIAPSSPGTGTLNSLTQTAQGGSWGWGGQRPDH